VGGNPLRAPAVLGLIWQAEAAGVWTVRGGMAALAHALADLLGRAGGTLRLQTPVAAILTEGGQVTGLRLADGAEHHCAQVVFNGDPAALPSLLDTGALPRRRTRPRSLSAHVWTFAGQVAPEARDRLAYHTVFFADDPGREFGPLAQGRIPRDPTIYVCAQDRATGLPDGPERFQFILNAPPHAPTQTEPPCPTDPFARLAQFGLTLTPQLTQDSVTPPARFARLFPHSHGALYGLSPDGALATFQRPTARTRVGGLYLAGGGVHPGAGVPMALTSGRHAAEAALKDRISAPMSRPMAMPGGISTGSVTVARAPSR